MAGAGREGARGKVAGDVILRLLLGKGDPLERGRESPGRGGSGCWRMTAYWQFVERPE